MTTFAQMIELGHERVCFHHDPESGLRAIVAIHSTRLGNALGGTRRWHYDTEEEALHDVMRLSEGMTWKAAVARLPMGGAKSVILLPKRGHPGSEPVARAMGRFVDTFNGTYIAAEDVGVDIQFVDWMAMETPHVMGGEAISRGGDPSPYTARGIIHGMRACLAHAGQAEDFAGVHVAIQGAGSVGRKIAKILAGQGARVTIADINPAKIDLLLSMCEVEVVPHDDLLFTECDLLAPCALGGVIDGSIIDRLRCPILCGGANNILDDPDEDAVALQRAGILYGPDFVVNAGGLIELAGVYLGMTREELDAKNDAIFATTAEVLRAGDSMDSTHAAAIEVARLEIERGSRERVHAG